MQKAVTRFFIALRSEALNGMTPVTLLVMILACILIANAAKPDNEEIRIGIVSEQKTAFSDRVIENLSDRSYECISFESEDALKDAIRSGKTDYGFVLDGDVSRSLSIRGSDGSVGFYTTPFSLYGEVVKESFAEAWLDALSDHIIEEEASKVFSDADDALIEELREKYREYKESGYLFDVNIIRTEGDTGDEKEADSFSGAPAIQGSQSSSGYQAVVIATAVFLSVFAACGKKYGGDLKTVLNGMESAERIRTLVTFLLAAALPIALAGAVLRFFSDREGGIAVMLSIFLRMAVLTAYSILWTLIIGWLIRREDTYMAMVPVVTGAQLLFGFVYLNMREYLPVLSILRVLFPVSVLL